MSFRRNEGARRLAVIAAAAALAGAAPAAGSAPPAWLAGSPQPVERLDAGHARCRHDLFMKSGIGM
jgi:hypothetical protein